VCDEGQDFLLSAVIASLPGIIGRALSRFLTGIVGAIYNLVIWLVNNAANIVRLALRFTDVLVAAAGTAASTVTRAVVRGLRLLAGIALDLLSQLIGLDGVVRNIRCGLQRLGAWLRCQIQRLLRWLKGGRSGATASSGNVMVRRQGNMIQVQFGNSGDWRNLDNNLLMQCPQNLRTMIQQTRDQLLMPPSMSATSGSRPSTATLPSAPPAGSGQSGPGMAPSVRPPLPAMAPASTGTCPVTTPCGGGATLQDLADLLRMCNIGCAMRTGRGRAGTAQTGPGSCFKARTKSRDGNGITTKFIEQREVGNGVFTFPGARSELAQLIKKNPEQWKVLHTRLQKNEKDSVESKLLRHIAELGAQNAQPGGLVFLDLPEMGARGWARVLGIEPCPDFIETDGKLVTGTFKHTRGNFINLYVEGEPQPIGVTPGHWFRSADRNDWLPAGDLREGERLQGMDGKTPYVEGVSICPEAEPVYNIEVEGDHCYRVGEQGVLVHNTSAPCCRVDDGPGTPGPYASLENTDNPDIPVMASRMFDPRQKAKILAANEQRNGGQLRSDDPMDPAQMLVRPMSVSPTQFPKPPKPRDANNCLNEAQIDHIKPFVNGGSNSYCNARVISQELNNRKRHGKPASGPC
jgi:hypothetical protein